MKISKNKLYAFLVCILAGLVLTILIYNLKFKYLISRNIVITVAYCILYLIVFYKFRLSVSYSILFTLITPLLIDLSVFFTNKDLIPVRFPFATTFLILGAFLGYFLTRSNRYKILGILFACSYFFISWYYIIPTMLNRMGEVNTKFNNNFFSTNVLNQDGDTLKLNSITHKALIIDFFFVGCAPCEEKRKMLEDVKNEIQNNDFGIFLICDGSISTFKEFQDYCVITPPKKGFQMLYDYEKNISKYFPDISGYPFELIFENNIVIKSYKGFDIEAYDPSKKTRIQTIKKILND